MMVGNNLKDTQLQQIVDKTILFHDKVALQAGQEGFVSYESNKDEGVAIAIRLV